MRLTTLVKTHLSCPGFPVRFTLGLLKKFALAVLALTHALAVAEQTLAPGAEQTQTVAAPLYNWEAYALIDKHFSAFDCQNQDAFEPEDVEEHMSQVWLPVTAGQRQFVDARSYAQFHHGVPPETAARLFADADTNGDRLVSVDESHAQLFRLVEQLDLNGDRTLTREELMQSEPGALYAKQVGAASAGQQGTSGSSAARGHQHNHDHHDAPDPVHQNSDVGHPPHPNS